MACRTSWWSSDISVGTVIGYSAKTDVRSGLMVELLHGDRCYRGKEYIFFRELSLSLRQQIRVLKSVFRFEHLKRELAFIQGKMKTGLLTRSSGLYTGARHKLYP